MTLPPHASALPCKSLIISVNADYACSPLVARGVVEGVGGQEVTGQGFLPMVLCSAKIRIFVS